MLPQLRDFIGRFRPATVPAGRESELAAELGPVLALLAPTEAECEQIIARASETAAKISAGAVRQVSEIEAAARRQAQTAREEAVQQLLVSARDETRQAMDEATAVVSRRRAPDERQVRELLDEALNLVLTLREGGPR